MAALTGSPSQAVSEVCSTLRPDWDGTQVTSLEEIAVQLSDLVTGAIFWLSISLVVQAKTNFVFLGVMLICGYAIVFVDPAFLDDDVWAALQDGSIGNQEARWAALIVIILFGTFRIVRRFMRVTI